MTLNNWIWERNLFLVWTPPHTLKDIDSIDIPIKVILG